MNIVIFGAGNYGKRYLSYVVHYRKEDNVVAFLDNYAVGSINGIPIYKVKDINSLKYDRCIIAVANVERMQEIKGQLINVGVADEKIISLVEEKDLLEEVEYKWNLYDEHTDARVMFLKNLSSYIKKERLEGCVAECGVFTGHFSFYINKFFPDRKLFLFDSFEGFGESDIEAERALNNVSFVEGQFNVQGLFAGTNERFVMSKMYYPEQCIIKKGFFPQTALGVEEKFVFVMLDMDLYQPMLAGLEFFYERMVQGGVILMHNYFHPELPGVEQALKDYEKKTGTTLCKMPIGDGCSIAIVKN